MGFEDANLARSFKQDEILDLLSKLVQLESPSRNKEALDKLGQFLADQLRGLGASVEISGNALAGDHVIGRFPGSAALRPALVIGHFDTVWPWGTLKTMPFRVDDLGFAYGPGIFDMKASLALFLAVMQSIHDSEFPLERPVCALFTSDEELGSPTSRELIDTLARECAYALILEPALTDGGLKTSRKGVGRFHLEVEGRAAHAGVAPEIGRSAIIELAHQILRIQALQEPAIGTTINVGVVHGGTTGNVVPAYASAEIDVRVTSFAEEARIVLALGSLSPCTEGVTLRLDGSFNRPPMERTPAIAGLYEQARQIARSIGLELTEGSSGGGSDGNFTAALGVPTLDGLGARGGGAHAADEHIVVNSLVERARLLLLLLTRLRVE
jgi:glutamate carboxypeptidase